jgi:hypothetical protein
MTRKVGESDRRAALELDAARLVDASACRSTASRGGIAEKGHQPPWPASSERQPAPRNAKPTYGVACGERRVGSAKDARGRAGEGLLALVERDDYTRPALAPRRLSGEVAGYACAACHTVP